MVFQHVAHEPLGTLNPMLKAAGLRIRYVNFGRQPDFVPNMDDYSGLVVLGGPMGVYEADVIAHLQTEMKAIEQALKKNIPILGICLGAQLLAAVLKSHVRKGPQPEVGWHRIRPTPHAADDPLFNHYRRHETVFQLHQDMFDPPKSATHLAESEVCPGQAFRYGEKVYGLQFHLEVDEAMVHRWLHRRDNKTLVGNPTEIDTQTPMHIGRSLELSQQTFSRFIDLFNLPPKKIGLGSSHGGRR